MTQEQINNVVVDVVYSATEIIHILPPNDEGVRGIAIEHFMMRDTIENVKSFMNFKNLDLQRFEDYEDELVREFNNMIDS